MAWVNLYGSDVAYTFESQDSGGAVAFGTDSVVTLSNGIGLDGDPVWTFLFSPTLSPVRLRITPTVYTQWAEAPPDSGIISYGSYDGRARTEAGQIQNEEAAPASSWSPSPFEVEVNSSLAPLNDMYVGLGSTAPRWSYVGDMEFLIEVWVDTPEQVSYNCECDDEYPTRTLAQMREYLMIRLGWGAMVSTPLPGVAVTLNSFLRDAQEQIYRQYKVFRLERFFTWQLVEGVRFYDLLGNEDVCTKKLDPRMLTWVGISQGDNFWRQLVCGIKPEFYYGDISSWPTHYEIRQCIEVWPPPSSDDWKLRIKGYFGLLPLEVDTDVNTIDYEAIQLFALANAKAHYGQPDAANYMGQYRDYIGAVTAGSHHTRRYVPSTEQSYPPPLPILTGYPGDP